jgi:TRAP-type C4-dicarboxylate transport system permease small subunit
VNGLTAPPVAPRLLRAIRVFERGLLTVLLSLMVALALLQIFLRNVFKTGWPWADPLLGVSLLWLTMLGALAATGSGRHISLDALSHALPVTARGVLVRVNAGLAAILCAALTGASWQYTAVLSEMGGGVLLGLPEWSYELILPVGFGLMTLRFLARASFPAAWQPHRGEDAV